MNESISRAPSSMDICLMAIRPKTLILSFVPVVLAALLVLVIQEHVDCFVFALILISAISIQIATNLWNDAADAASGLDDGSERLGPPRVTSLGLVSVKTMRIASFVFLAIAALCGLYLVYQGGWPILMIGLVSLFFAFCYSSGPYPISGSPFGEVFVILFFGIIAVMGSVYLLCGQWSIIAFWAGFYAGLPAAGVLTVNNHRDRVGDAAGGRQTLAIKLGPERTKRLYAYMLELSALGLVHLFVLLEPEHLPLFALLVAIALALFALFGPIRRLFVSPEGKALNNCLAATSQFQLIWLGAFALLALIS